MSLVESAGFGAVFLAENIPFFHIGTFLDGVSIAYGECKTGMLLIGTVTYQGSGTSAICSTVDTAGNPNSPAGSTQRPLVQTCDFQLYEVTSATPLYVNPSTECAPSCVVSTRPSTWGGVKALYRR
jgi:hypothetical protein